MKEKKKQTFHAVLSNDHQTVSEVNHITRQYMYMKLESSSRGQTSARGISKNSEFFGIQNMNRIFTIMQLFHPLSRWRSSLVWLVHRFDF